MRFSRYVYFDISTASELLIYIYTILVEIERMYSRRGLLVDRYPARGASNTTSTTVYDTNPAVDL